MVHTALVSSRFQNVRLRPVWSVQVNDRYSSLWEKQRPVHCESTFASPSKIWGRAVCDCERIPKVEGSSGILFLKNSFDSDMPIAIPDGFLCAFEPQNQRAAALLRAAGAAAVTCGMCAKETLSISSLDYGAAALSLQRSITTVSGDVVEPRDITVELHSAVSPRQMLAVCMVLLMAGVDSSYGYVI